MFEKEYSFDEFDGVSFSEWKKRISYDQKKISVDSLDWKVSERISVSPFQHRDSISDFSRRNGKFFSSGIPCLNLSPCSDKNDDIHEALLNGADGVVIKVLDHFSFDKSLKNVIPNICHLSFESANPLGIYEEYYNWLTKHSIKKSNVSGYLFNSELSIKNIDRSELPFINDLLSTSNFLPGIRFIKLSGGVAGENPHEVQLANICSELVYYIEKFSDKGFEIERIISSLFFQIEIGNSFFLEIAKIRSLKFLSAIILKEYDLDKCTYIPIHSTTMPKDVMEQISDCTQTLSALLGGAHSVCSSVDEKNRMTRRVSRNVLNILKEESYFDKTNNPIEGSYFIESITEQMIRSAWSLFLEKQKSGGFLSVALNVGDTIAS